MASTGTMRKMTAAELARELRVSAATVSYALNGRPGVSERTRERIVEAALRHGVVDETEIGGPTKTRLLGLILADIGNPFYSELAVSSASASRARGFGQVMRDAGVRIQQNLNLTTCLGFEGRVRVGQHLLALNEKLPDVVVCGIDAIALGLIGALACSGIRCPEDVAVTGFDGLTSAKWGTADLTTVVQPRAHMAENAVKQLNVHAQTTFISCVLGASIVLAIPFIMLSKKRQGNEKQLAENNRDKAIVSLYCYKTFIDDADITYLKPIKGQYGQKIVVLSPGRHAFEGMFETIDIDMRQNINFKSRKLNFDISLEAGHSYTLAVYLYSPEQREAYYKGDVGVNVLPFLSVLREKARALRCMSFAIEKTNQYVYWCNKEDVSLRRDAFFNRSYLYIYSLQVVTNKTHYLTS